jgi:hypothetical protein
VTTQANYLEVGMNLATEVLWTHREKGGRYRLLTAVKGAGNINGTYVLVYQDTTNGELYGRLTTEWYEKMRLVLP